MVSLAIQRLEMALQAKRFDHTVAKGWDAEAKPRRSQTTGVESLDRMLSGGWARGEVSELVGRRSSGRLSVLMATLAAATSRGEVVALVDALDRLDVGSAVVAGVDLDRLLWVRGPALRSGQPLQDRAVAQAVCALDLIVRAGGFSVVALDLSDVPARHLRALPLATWMRVAHVLEGRDTVCLLVGDVPMGRSARGVSVRLTGASQWSGSSTQSRRFGGLDIGIQIGSAQQFISEASSKAVS
jgi:hypothetical protein